MGMNNRDGWPCPYFYFLFWLIAEPLIQFIMYSDDSSPYYDKFISRPINGNHDDLVNLELNLAVQNLFGFATF